MKKEKVEKIIIASLFLFLVLFSQLNTVLAAVNTEYSQNQGVIEGDLDQKLKNSNLMEAIASLIYGLASLVEKLVGDVFETLTGDNMFPWADKVIFNTVPFLDINFLNPSEGSLFLTTANNGKNGVAQDTILAKIIRNIYFTIFVLAVSLLGTVVGIMAIKLAISTIASEKAKYKESLVKFLVSLVLLFTIHYAMSFMFFVNEQMVIVASNILTDSIKDVEINLDFTPKNRTELVDEFLEANTGTGIEFGKIFQQTFVLSTLVDKILDTAFKDGGSYIKDETEVDGVSNKQLAGYLLSQKEYVDERIPMASGGTKVGLLEGFIRLFYKSNREELDAVNILAADVQTIRSLGTKIDNIEFTGKTKKDKTVYNVYNGYKKDANSSTLEEFQKTTYYKILLERSPKDTPQELYEAGVQEMKAYKYMMKGYEIYILKKKSDGNATTLISDMGQYFKDSAWTYDTDSEGKIDGWYANEITLQGAILYAIFVLQSMLFFFAYIRRFFYVVILAICAPIIVIYDFLGKVMS